MLHRSGRLLLAGGEAKRSDEGKEECAHFDMNFLKGNFLKSNFPAGNFPAGNFPEG
jgi:hypothetical protein